MIECHSRTSYKISCNKNELVGILTCQRYEWNDGIVEVPYDARVSIVVPEDYEGRELDFEESDFIIRWETEENTSD